MVDVAVMRGVSVDGERWTLISQDTPDGPGVLLELTTTASRLCWGTGDRSTPLRPGRVTGASVGGVFARGDEDEPALWLLKPHRVDRAAVVHLSDGTREDLPVVDDPREEALRWAVLLYPRHLDVHRLDLYDGDGAVLEDAASS